MHTPSYVKLAMMNPKNRHVQPYVFHIPRWLVLLVPTFSNPLLYSIKPKLLILTTRISVGFDRILLHPSISPSLGELPTFQAKKEEPASATLGRGTPRPHALKDET